MYGILVYDYERAKRNKDFIDHYFELSEKYGIKLKLCIVDEYYEIPDYKHRYDYLSSLIFREKKVDFAIIRITDCDFQWHFGRYGVKTHNNYDVSYYANHKGRCIEYISQNTDVPCPETMTIVRNSDLSFFSKPGGIVVKSASGHGGNEVFRAFLTEKTNEGHTGLNIGFSSESDADRITEIIKHDDIIIQPFIEGPVSDVRVYVVFGKIVAAVKRTAPAGEFRSNYSLGGEVSAYTLSDSEIETVNKIIKLFDFSMAGIDFIIDKNGAFVFNEIEDVVGSRMLYKTHPDMDILDIFFRKLSE